MRVLIALIACALLVARAEYFDEEFIMNSIYADSGHWTKQSAGNESKYNAPSLLFDESVTYEDDTNWEVQSSQLIAWVAFDFVTPQCVDTVYMHGNALFDATDVYTCGSFFVEKGASRNGPWERIVNMTSCRADGLDSPVETQLSGDVDITFMRLTLCACEDCVTDGSDPRCQFEQSARKRELLPAIGVDALEFRLTGYNAACKVPASDPINTVQQPVRAENAIAESALNAAVTAASGFATPLNVAYKRYSGVSVNYTLPTSSAKQAWFTLDLGENRCVQSLTLWGALHEFSVDPAAFTCREFQVYSSSSATGPWTFQGKGNCYRHHLIGTPANLCAGAGTADRYLNVSVCACDGCSSDVNAYECHIPGSESAVVGGTVFSGIEVAITAGACTAPADDCPAIGDNGDDDAPIIPPSPTPPGTDNIAAEGSKKRGGLSSSALVAIIVGIIGCCLLLLLIAVIVFLVVRRRKRAEEVRAMEMARNSKRSSRPLGTSATRSTRTSRRPSASPQFQTSGEMRRSHQHSSGQTQVVDNNW